MIRKSIHVLTLILTSWAIRGQNVVSGQYYINGVGDTIRGYFEVSEQDKLNFRTSITGEKQELDLSQVSRVYFKDNDYWVEEAEDLAEGKLKTGKRKKMLLKSVFDCDEVKLFERLDPSEPSVPQLYIKVGDGGLEPLAFVEVKVPGKMTSRGYELERPIFFGGTEHYILNTLNQNEIVSININKFVTEKYVLRDTVLYHLSADWLRYWEQNIASVCPRARLQSDAKYSSGYLSRYLEEFRLCTEGTISRPKRKAYSLSPFLSVPFLGHRLPPASLGVQLRFNAAWGGVVGISLTQSILRTPRFFSPFETYSYENEDMRVLQVYLGYHFYRKQKTSFIPFISYGEGSYLRTLYKGTASQPSHNFRYKLRGIWIGAEICTQVRDRLRLNLTLMGLSGYEMRLGCSYLF